jgi:TatD DNase family protein
MTAGGPLPRLVDTHCHLDAPQFEGDSPAALVARARSAGVTRLVTIGTDVKTSESAVALAKAHEGVWATVGVDPNDAAGWGDADLARLEALTAEPEVVAIGEIGLDYYWNRAPREVQARAFRAQLELAESVGLPVVIHNRDADVDTEAALLEWAAGRTDGDRPLGVLHCYAGDLAMAERLVAAGFLVSLAGIVTFKNAARTHEVAARLPLEAIVLETDAPFLAPHPHRGARNEPAFVPLVAARVAELRELAVEAVAGATTANAERLFRWQREPGAEAA